MGIYASYPTLFNTTQILSPSTWQETSKVVESVAQSEAGTDIVDVVRYDKLTVQASYNIAETISNGVGNGWAKTFKTFSKMTSFTLKRYDALVGGYEERTVRMRDYKAQLRPKSDKLSAVNGVWEISFSLEEI